MAHWSRTTFCRPLNSASQHSGGHCQQRRGDRQHTQCYSRSDQYGSDDLYSIIACSTALLFTASSLAPTRSLTSATASTRPTPPSFTCR